MSVASGRPRTTPVAVRGTLVRTEAAGAAGLQAVRDEIRLGHVEPGRQSGLEQQHRIPGLRKRDAAKEITTCRVLASASTRLCGSRGMATDRLVLLQPAIQQTRAARTPHPVGQRGVVAPPGRARQRTVADNQVVRLRDRSARSVEVEAFGCLGPGRDQQVGSDVGRDRTRSAGPGSRPPRTAAAVGCRRRRRHRRTRVPTCRSARSARFERLTVVNPPARAGVAPA